MHTHTPPTWWPTLHHLPHPAPQALQPWLLDTGSTTQRLQQHGLAPWKARWYRHSWRALHAEESLLLHPEHITPRFAMAMVRQVVLYSAALPCMFARSVFPKTTLAEHLPHIRTLGSESLGPLLFSDPTLRRGPFSFTVLSPGHTDYEAAIAPLDHPPPQLYARRSVLHWQERPLLLHEVFYPQMGGL